MIHQFHDMTLCLIVLGLELVVMHVLSFRDPRYRYEISVVAVGKQHDSFELACLFFKDTSIFIDRQGPSSAR